MSNPWPEGIVSVFIPTPPAELMRTLSLPLVSAVIVSVVGNLIAVLVSPVWTILSAISTSPVNDPVQQSIFGVPVNPAEVMGTRNDYTDIKFLYFSKKMLSKGATILGGCCETKPFHIEKISILKN